MLSAVIMTVAMLICHNAECRYDDCSCAEFCYTECHCDDSGYVEFC